MNKFRADYIWEMLALTNLYSFNFPSRNEPKNQRLQQWKMNFNSLIYEDIKWEE
jgi:hypothetical protein